MKDYSKAINDYDKAISIDPKDASAYYGRGWVYGKKNDYTKAIKDFTKAIELDPNNAAVYRNRGYANQLKGDYKMAIKDYKTALEIDSKITEARRLLVESYILLHRWKIIVIAFCASWVIYLKRKKITLSF